MFVFDAATPSFLQTGIRRFSAFFIVQIHDKNDRFSVEIEKIWNDEADHRWKNDACPHQLVFTE